VFCPVFSGVNQQREWHCTTVKVKKVLKPYTFFMGKPSQNYGVSPKYDVTQFCLQPDISEYTPP